jgi:hypothetical protein
MNYRVLGFLGAVATASAVVSLAGVSTAAQSVSGTQAKSKASVPSFTVARTPDGSPDLQGVWSFAVGIPLERPGKFGEKQAVDEETGEAIELQKVAIERNVGKDSRAGAGTEADVARAYNAFWWDFGTNVAGNRTSLIVDPSDGRLPALTDAGKKRAEARTEARRRNAFGPEDRGVGERCILGFNSGPPMNSSAYNNNMQLVQGPGYVAILNEMVHNARIIPLDGRPHLSGDLRQWVGDSRGRWEGDTLVVDTTNFLAETSLNGSTRNMHLIERFTRVGPDTLLYKYTVEDPTTWTKPWTVELPMSKGGELYEYACHEGNYGMFGIMTGARAMDKASEEEAKEAAKKGSR